MTNETMRKLRPSIAIPPATLKSSTVDLILVSEGEMVLTCKVNFVGNENVSMYLHIQLSIALLAVSAFQTIGFCKQHHLEVWIFFSILSVIFVGAPQGYTSI
jgi:hypothetical protein